LDANTTFNKNDSDNYDELARRSELLKDLLSGMVEVVFHKYSSSHSDKLTFSEFCEFVRDDDNVQKLVSLLSSCLGGDENVQ
jgi:hypothetical protein